MNRILKRRLRNFWRGTAGQVLPIAALMMVVLTAMVGLAIDVGDIYLAHRELQASTDAAALAGAAIIPTSTSASLVYAEAASVSSGSTGSNGYKTLTNVQMVSGYPVLKCLTTMQTQGISCVGPLQYNAIQVVQQATVPLYFARIIGKNSMTISASATAAKGGGSSRPYNIAIALDTTLSMLNPDTNCGGTAMQCELNGAAQLLTYLDPCGTSQATCNITGGQSTNSVVRVSIFGWPQIQISNETNYSQCSNSASYAYYYTFPTAGATSYNPTTSTYQYLGFYSDYRLSDTTSALNSNSALAIAMNGVAGCNYMQTPNNAGYVGTYNVAAIYAAQAALTHEQTLFPDSQNVMIIISDGDDNAPHCNAPQTPDPATCPNGTITVMQPPANTTGIYPSYYGQCGQAVTAAQFATSQGTRVYSVAYGSPSSGCTTDTSGQGHAAGAYPNIQPCTEMSMLASASYYFFSDYMQSGSGSTCVAPQVMTSLNNIFLQIAGDLTVARIIPDSVT